MFYGQNGIYLIKLEKNKYSAAIGWNTLNFQTNK